MCGQKDELEFDLFVSPDNGIMLADKTLFQRQAGPTAPSTPVIPRVAPGRVAGTWTVRSGNPGDSTTSTLTLTASGGRLSGKTSVRQTNSLGWRKRDCQNQAEMTANYNFDVTGSVSGAQIELEFSPGSPTYSGCPCKPKVCEVVAAGVSLGSRRVKMTLDGNHLIGSDLLLTRK